MGNGAQLITYVDRLGGGGLPMIADLLNGPFDGAFRGVHLLPFYYPFDGADAGFDPIDHSQVDPRLGDWDDVRHISQTHDVMADLIANHISEDSTQFRDFLANGDNSEFAGMFLEPTTVYPGGPSEAERAAIYRPRPGTPFTTKALADGSSRQMWTTFTPEQIDLDVGNVRARQYLVDVLDRFAAAGVTHLRLDAIGYAVKTAGTSCFMTPETIDFIMELVSEVRTRGMLSLLEIHSHYSDQTAAATLADQVYNFALPPLVLHALYTGSVAPLRDWLRVSPPNAVTVLDTHDGIGVIDVGPAGAKPGLLSPPQLDELVGGIHAASNGQSQLATGAAASNVDLYQVNCTFYSALGCDDDRYLLARLTQFLAPGTAQVYYAGLLAAPNDMALLKRTGIGRDINRPYYTPSQITSQMERPVVRRQLALTRFRNTHPAFNGDFTIGSDGAHELVIARRTHSASITARLNFADASFTLEESEGSRSRTLTHWDEF